HLTKTLALSSLLLHGLGCTPSQPVRETDPRASSSARPPPVDPVASAHAAVGPVRCDHALAAKHIRTRLGKPPLAEHAFDVTLTNADAGPVWMFLPTTFPYDNEDHPAP